MVDTHCTRRDAGSEIQPFSVYVYNAYNPISRVVQISCLHWSSTRLSRKDARGWTGDRGRRVGKTGTEQVRQERKEDARQSGRRREKARGRAEKGREGPRLERSRRVEVATRVT